MKTITREFYNSARAHLERLERLRLGPAVLNMQNGADAANLWDIEYLYRHLPIFQRLRTLEYDGFGLDGAPPHLLYTDHETVSTRQR